MVNIYVAEIAHLPDPIECPKCMKGLSVERRDKIRRQKVALKRKQSLGAGLLLKYALLQRGIALQRFFMGENGKPEVEGACFNLSHSGNLVICAVSEKPVGCDVEKIEEASDKVLKRIATIKEKNYYEQFAGEERNRAFYRLWTMKESYSKMTGEGMRMDLKRVEFLQEESIRVFLNGKLSNCMIKEYEIDGYAITVCAKENVFAERLEYVELGGMISGKENIF